MSSTPAVGFRLSPLQERAWPSQPEMVGVPPSCTVTIRGEADGDAIHRAFRAAVARHEILRTTFRRRAGFKLPYQVIHDELPLSWEHLDLSGLPLRERRESLSTAVREARRHPYDFEEGPLLRARLLTLAAEEHVLLFGHPSMCGDSRSLALLLGEVASAVGGGEGHEPDEVDLQYADYAEWHHGLIESADDEAHAARAFWGGLDLDTTPAAIPPLGRTGAVEGDFDLHAREVVIPPGVRDRLGRLAEARHAPSPRSCSPAGPP